MNLKKASKDSPFYKAIMFMKDITRNLNENSCLFDLLLQYNSGISNDIDLLRRKRKRYKDNDSKYELSMMTVKEVTEHLEEILLILLFSILVMMIFMHSTAVLMILYFLMIKNFSK